MAFKIVEKTTDSVIVSLPRPYNEEGVSFKNSALEAWMRNRGIEIPKAQRESFGGKKFVCLDDPEFSKAFQEIYATKHFSHEKYEWKLS